MYGMNHRGSSYQAEAYVSIEERWVHHHPYCTVGSQFEPCNTVFPDGEPCAEKYTVLCKRDGEGNIVNEIGVDD